MRLLIAAAALLVGAASAHAQPHAQQSASLQSANADVMKYAVDRNGGQIGTFTIEFRRNGPETSVNMETKIEVKVAFITAYRFEHSATERWVSGKLASMKAVTDDNGTPHKLEVAPKGNGLLVEADGKSTQVDAGMIPASLWNTSLLRQTAALDTQKGTIMKINVTDGGMDSVDVLGRPVKAHRYSIKSTSSVDAKSTFSQDVWYDEKGNLVRAQFSGSDGSIISYRVM
jgi:Family of unknown function (DUF6134)